MVLIWPWSLSLVVSVWIWEASAASVPAVAAHMRFAVEDGEIRSLEKPLLRLNAQGGKLLPGDPLILWPCHPHSHEMFQPLSAESLIRLSSIRNLCLNAEGGAAAGRNIVTWPCTHRGEVVGHEQFEHDTETLQLRLKHDRSLCMNAKGGLAVGAEVILWPCGEHPDPNEQFVFEDGRIALAANRTLHFNVQGGDLDNQDATKQVGKKIVIWTCQPGPHERFQFTRDGRLRLATTQALCVNAEGGLGPGRRLVLFPCADAPAPNELFQQDDERGIIFASAWPNLAFNAAGGALVAGDQVVLWPLDVKLEL